VMAVVDEAATHRDVDDEAPHPSLDDVDGG
jgi:hypothetical protein